jgi:hypothetical protein
MKAESVCSLHLGGEAVLSNRKASVMYSFLTSAIFYYIINSVVIAVPDVAFLYANYTVT